MTITSNRRFLTALVLGLGLTASSGFAAGDFFFNTFSNLTGEAEIAGWFHAWGGVSENAVLDSAKNGPFGPTASSGSMKLSATFNPAGSDQQFAWFHALNGNSWGFWDAAATLPASQYESFEFDIYFDPSCPVDDGGRIANLEHALIDYENTSAASWITTAYYPSNSGRWIHVVHPIPGTFSTLIAGCGLKVWSSYAGGLNGTTIFWVDNLKLKARIGPVVLPSLHAPKKAAAAGLWIGEPAPGGGGTRQNVYTASTLVPWYQVATPLTPVSYSMTIAAYPGNSGFQTHLFIVGDPASGTSAIDWNGTNVLYLRIMNNADGSGYANVWFKTNTPSAYSNAVSHTAMIYADNEHHLVTNLNSATVTGKWTLSFTSDTAGTLTAPDNSSTNFVFPADAAAFFPSPYAVFGIQGNNDAAGGQGVTFSKLEIKNPNFGDVSDTFASPPLNNSVWGIAAGNAAGIQVVPAGLWVSWTLPAAGYDLLAAPAVNAPSESWTSGLITNAVAGAFNFAEAGRIVVPWSSLPDPNRFYLRLAHAPVFARLQVLMPGETSAPMTPTGKAGTPIAQKVGVPFNVVINACDDYWQKVDSSDVAYLTSNDPAASLPPSDFMVNGTITFSVTLGTAGSATISVSDLTDGSKAANTGTATQVNP
jgi:hypothetical protein